MDRDYTTVGVRLTSDYAKKMFYFRAYEPVALNDIVVVETKNGMLTGVVSFIDKDELITYYPQREVVCVVDTAAFAKRQTKRAKVSELNRKIDNRIKEIQSTILVEVLASQDETLAALLKELKDVSE